jgi:hypothetical protein
LLSGRYCRWNKVLGQRAARQSANFIVAPTNVLKSTCTAAKEFLESQNMAPGFTPLMHLAMRTMVRLQRYEE